MKKRKYITNSKMQHLFGLMEYKIVMIVYTGFDFGSAMIQQVQQVPASQSHFVFILGNISVEEEFLSGEVRLWKISNRSQQVLSRLGYYRSV